MATDADESRLRRGSTGCRRRAIRADWSRCCRSAAGSNSTICSSPPISRSACSRPACSSRPRRACSTCKALPVSSPRCSSACSSARIAFSWLSDRFGRRSIFTFALLWYSVGAFIMAFQNTPESIDLWRLIASIGLGVELVNIDTYVSELVPKEQRGPAFAYNQFVMFTAVPVVAFPRLAIGAADHSRPRRLALGGDHRLDRRLRDLVDSPQLAGIAALARAARPHRGSRGALSRIWKTRFAPTASSCRRRSPSPAKPSAKPAPGWKCGTRPIAAAPSCW